MSLEQHVDRLYGLPPEHFTAARDEAAKADRDLAPQLRALRKPTLSAWVVNMLVRRQPTLLDELLALGPALAQAQADGSGDALRMLGEQRRDLVSAVTSAAAEAAGRDLPAAARAEVESTLEAALADPASAEAVRSGALVRPLSYAGFGEVDLADAVAGPRPQLTASPPGKPARAAPRPKADLSALQQAAMEAAGQLDDAVRTCEQAQREHEAAEAAVEAAVTAVAAAERALASARAERTAAEAAVRKAARAQERAAAEVTSAQQRAERARAALDMAARQASA